MKSNNIDIVFDIRMFDDSGIGQYIKNVMSIFRDDTLNAKFLSNKKKQPNEINFYCKIYSILEQFKYPFCIPKCNLFWSPHYNVPIFPINATHRIVTIHDVFHLTNIPKQNVLKKIYAKYLFHCAVHRSNRIITVSEFSKAEIVKYTKCNPYKIEVIYNGVRQKSNIKDFSIVRNKYSLPELYILYVGNVKPHKNLKRLLEAYLLLDQDLKDTYKIVIIGKKNGFITNDESLFSWINQMPDLLSNVIFTGFVEDEDMDTIYLNAALFVFPSLYEGFGFPPLEAMLNKCPVIVSKIDSLQEICGDAALYFNPLDVKDICDCMLKVLHNNNNIKLEMVEKGIDRIKKFTWDQSREKHLSLFNSIV